MDERFSTLDGDLMTEALMMEEFNRLVKETAELEVEVPPPPAPAPLSSKLELPQEESNLEEAMHLHQKEMKEKLAGYLRKKKKEENGLLFLDGFCGEETILANRTTGGFFFSYEGFGVAVNPGKHFLKRFTEAEHHVSEIDAVVVTREDPEDCQDVSAIYQLNLLCNSNSASEFHLIKYFLHPSLFAKMGSQLKPQFKQERNCLVSLDLFEERESLDLSPQIHLTYMSAEKHKNHNLALVFEMGSTKMGYFSKAPYALHTLDSLNGCDTLILGFEETNSSDLQMVKPMERCLGFTGIFNICNELNPRVAFILEHSGAVGDIRMEVLKRLKSRLASEHCTTLLFPVETGLVYDFTTERLKAGNQWIECSQVRTIQPEGHFSPLHFLSTDSIL